AGRGQGLGHPANPGADRGWLPCCDPLRADHRQDHASERADWDDRQRLRPHPGDGALARRIPPRDDGLPKGKHDDQVDSTVQFLDWFKTPMPHWGFFRGDPNKGRAATRRATSQTAAHPNPMPPAAWNGSPSRTSRIEWWAPPARRSW